MNRIVKSLVASTAIVAGLAATLVLPSRSAAACAACSQMDRPVPVEHTGLLLDRAAMQMRTGEDASENAREEVAPEYALYVDGLTYTVVVAEDNEEAWATAAERVGEYVTVRGATIMGSTQIDVDSIDAADAVDATLEGTFLAPTTGFDATNVIGPRFSSDNGTTMRVNGLPDGVEIVDLLGTGEVSQRVRITAHYVVMACGGHVESGPSPVYWEEIALQITNIEEIETDGEACPDCGGDAPECDCIRGDCDECDGACTCGRDDEE